MSTRFGDVSTNRIIENHFNILVLQKVVDHLLTNKQDNVGVSKLDLEKIRNEVLEIIRNEYPRDASRLEFEKSS